jgi:2-amino-4-hydroxy-6-hydroxymethyldihydropteridine diphosphokinase
VTEKIVLGLGGNVGGAAAVLARFVSVARAFEAWGPVWRSRVYRSAPVGPAQADFLNAALSVRVDEPPTPGELASMVLETERLLGRDRSREVRWGPRTIDVDVLLWGERVGRWPGLEVPHPRLAGRRFALAPLADLVGDALVIPGVGRTVGELLREVRAQVVAETDLSLD